MTNYESLSLVLAALAAFFTLITGAAAIFAAWALFYFNKLKNERENEIKMLNQLQDEMARKISDTEKLKDGGKVEIERIKNDYQELRNKFFHLVAPSLWYTPMASGGGGGSGVTIAQLQAQINALMAQLSALQNKVDEDEPTQEELQKAEDLYIDSEIDRRRGK